MEQQNSLIETHCHLDYLKTSTIPETLKRCREQNVSKVITVSVSPDNQDTALAIANQYQDVYCTQGVHPHEAKNFFKMEAEKKIITNIKSDKSKKIVALGEMGLDYYYERSAHGIQKEVFERQLQMAVDFKMPIIIHTRDADEDTISILKNFLPQLKYGKAIHCFTAKMELAHFALEEGFYLGFNGIITFKKADNVREALNITPMDRILLETDAPFLSPEPHRGKENSPAYLPFIAERIAKLKGVQIEELLPQIYKNTVNLFPFIA